METPSFQSKICPGSAGSVFVVRPMAGACGHLSCHDQYGAICWFTMGKTVPHTLEHTFPACFLLEGHCWHMGHCASPSRQVWTSSKGWSWAVVDQGHIRRETLAWPPARASPTALGAQEHSQVRITSQCSQGALDQCGSQQPSGPSSSKLLGAAWLCFGFAPSAESREDPSATGLLPVLQLGSARQVSLL